MTTATSNIKNMVNQNTQLKDRIAGVIYGMAIGDAMGMPAELWNNKLIKQYFKTWISDFLPGPKESAVAYQYQAAQFTDDTAQALVILQTLIDAQFVINSKILGANLLQWAVDNHAFTQNILGPSSKAALEALQNQAPTTLITDKALSNGSAMRIAPIGCLFKPSEQNDLARYVAQISSVTHTSDITVAGAAMIAMGVSSALYHDNMSSVLDDILAIEPFALTLGASTFSPSLVKRVQLAIQIANQYKHQDQKFIEEIYDVIGAGVNISESVPCAIGIAYYAKDVYHAAQLCANMGGDTDTIGAMSCAILGGLHGVANIPQWLITKLKQANPTTDFDYYINHIYNYVQERK